MLNHTSQWNRHHLIVLLSNVVACEANISQYIKLLFTASESLQHRRHVLTTSPDHSLI